MDRLQLLERASSKPAFLLPSWHARARVRGARDGHVHEHVRVCEHDPLLFCGHHRDGYARESDPLCLTIAVVRNRMVETSD